LARSTNITAGPKREEPPDMKTISRNGIQTQSRGEQVLWGKALGVCGRTLPLLTRGKPKEDPVPRPKWRRSKFLGNTSNELDQEKGKKPSA